MITLRLPSALASRVINSEIPGFYADLIDPNPYPGSNWESVRVGAFYRDDLTTPEAMIRALKDADPIGSPPNNGRFLSRACEVASSSLDRARRSRAFDRGADYAWRAVYVRSVALETLARRAKARQA